MLINIWKNKQKKGTKWKISECKTYAWTSLKSSGLSLYVYTLLFYRPYTKNSEHVLWPKDSAKCLFQNRRPNLETTHPSSSNTRQSFWNLNSLQLLVFMHLLLSITKNNIRRHTCSIYLLELINQVNTIRNQI